MKVIRSVEDWAKERGIFALGTPEGQCLKTVSEVGELADSVSKGLRPDIIDAIGDITVTLIILARMYNTTLDRCLEDAYSTIKNRTGIMKNGTFIKDE